MKIIRLTESNNKYQWYKIYIAKISGRYKNVIVLGSNIYYCYVWLSNDKPTAYQTFQNTLDGNSTVISKYYTSRTDKKKIAMLKGYSILNAIQIGTALPPLGSILTSQNRNYRNRNTPYLTHHIDGFEVNNSVQNKLYILPANFSIASYSPTTNLNSKELLTLKGVHWILETKFGTVLSQRNLQNSRQLVAKLCYTDPFNPNNTPQFYDVYLEIK